MSLPFDQDLSLCFADRIGDGGLDRATFDEALAGCAEAVADLRYYRDSGSLPLLNLPEAKRDLETLQPIAERFAERFERVLVLGTGGSTLGGQTLVELAQSPFAPREGRPWVHFLDNVDPDRFDELYRAADLARTGVIVISKSGGTAETLTQLLTLLPKLQAAVGEAALPDHLLVITEPYDNPLRRLSDQLR
ncbi:MAG: glucose-6-phosphate isomerase, partial [Alphaproteobacteria bacterium]|nr:glucose-6-phosphate isomerase [Alphaproteobacteria bacterium]